MNQDGMLVNGGYQVFQPLLFDLPPPLDRLLVFLPPRPQGREPRLKVPLWLLVNL